MKNATLKIWMFLLAGLAMPRVAAAAPIQPNELYAAVERAISGYEPLSAGEDLKRLSGQHSPEQVSDALLRLARAPQQNGIVRLRAVEALGYVPTEAGRSYLHELVEQNSASGNRSAYVFTLAAALRALGHFLPYEAELSRIAPHLNHESANVREAAAMALQAMPAGATQKLLQRRLSQETDPGVQGALRRALRSVSAEKAK